MNEVPSSEFRGPIGTPLLVWPEDDREAQLMFSTLRRHGIRVSFAMKRSIRQTWVGRYTLDEVESAAEAADLRGVPSMAYIEALLVANQRAAGVQPISDGVIRGGCGAGTSCQAAELRQPSPKASTTMTSAERQERPGARWRSAAAICSIAVMSASVVGSALLIVRRMSRSSRSSSSMGGDSSGRGGASS